jgi:hypothetical protein
MKSWLDGYVCDNKNGCCPNSVVLHYSFHLQNQCQADGPAAARTGVWSPRPRRRNPLRGKAAQRRAIAAAGHSRSRRRLGPAGIKYGAGRRRPLRAAFFLKSRIARGVIVDYAKR